MYWSHQVLRHGLMDCGGNDRWENSKSLFTVWYCEGFSKTWVDNWKTLAWISFFSATRCIDKSSILIVIDIFDCSSENYRLRLWPLRDLLQASLGGLGLCRTKKVPVGRGETAIGRGGKIMFKLGTSERMFKVKRISHVHRIVYIFCNMYIWYIHIVCVHDIIDMIYVFLNIRRNQYFIVFIECYIYYLCYILLCIIYITYSLHLHISEGYILSGNSHALNPGS